MSSRRAYLEDIADRLLEVETLGPEELADLLPPTASTNGHTGRSRRKTARPGRATAGARAGSA